MKSFADSIQNTFLVLSLLFTISHVGCGDDKEPIRYEESAPVEIDGDEEDVVDEGELDADIVDGEGVGDIEDNGGGEDSDSEDQEDRGGGEDSDSEDQKDLGGEEDEEKTFDCPGAEDWPEELAVMEQEVLDLVNQHRAEGADCGTSGGYSPTEPLVMDGALQCAARLHSLDMAERNYMAHTNPDGVGPYERIRAAGYTGGYPQGENILQGRRSAEHAVGVWMASDGHCGNIMNPAFNEIGVGAHGQYWTQTFGRR